MTQRPSSGRSGPSMEVRESSEIPAIRDHEQDPLREAAMWVVLNWDAQRSQHGTMPALRRALGLPGERPTQEEAERRIGAYIGVCSTCKNTGWVCAGTGKPADFKHGSCCDPDDSEFGGLAGGGCPSADGCPDCDARLVAGDERDGNA